MRKKMMKILVVFFIVLASFVVIRGIPMVKKENESMKSQLITLVKQRDLRNIPAIKKILENYIKLKFPKLQNHYHQKIVKSLVSKIKGIIQIRSLKEQSKNVWWAKGDMLARMLR